MPVPISRCLPGQWCVRPPVRSEAAFRDGLTAFPPQGFATFRPGQRMLTTVRRERIETILT